MPNSKKKGNKYEREVTKWFKSWTGYEFSRVPASGGLRWQKQDNINGDVICTDKSHGRRFKFSIEAKSYKDINFEHIILGNKSTKILEFWKQTLESSERSNKIPILLMRYNGMPKDTHFIIIDINLYTIIQNNLYKIKEPHFIDPINGFVILNSNSLLKVEYIKLHKYLKHSNL